jgi:hypothetical protein
MLVKQVARLIRSFNQEQLAQLVALVPQLQTVEPDKSDVSRQQEELAAYFDDQLDALAEYRPMQDDDPFIGSLTVADFFALPEREQDRLWREAHAEVEGMQDQPEQPVQPDALPAR